MSRERVELIEQGWRAYNSGDLDALLEMVTGDVEFRPPAHLVDGIVFRGRAGIRAWAERTAETWREIEGSPRELATVGEHVVVAVDMRMIGRASCVLVRQPAFVVYTFREGKVAAMIAYPDQREALEAVGGTE